MSVARSGQPRDGSGTAGPVAALLRQLPLDEVIVHQPQEVARYLERHPDLVATVQRVTRAAVGRLGGRAQLSLELHRDPEIRDKLLTLYARQAAYDDELLVVLDQIADEQHLDPSASSGWFQLTTDLQPPR